MILDVSAIEFNIKHGMDWNKWINEGIPYLNKKQSKKLHLHLFGEQKVNSDPENNIKLSNPNDIEKTSA
jgi:hypothetical protein